MSEIKLKHNIFKDINASKVFIPKRLYESWKYEKGDYVIEGNLIWELTDMNEETITVDGITFTNHTYEFTNTKIIEEIRK